MVHVIWASDLQDSGRGRGHGCDSTLDRASAAPSCVVVGKTINNNNNNSSYTTVLLAGELEVEATEKDKRIQCTEKVQNLQHRPKKSHRLIKKTILFAQNVGKNRPGSVACWRRFLTCLSKNFTM